VASTRAAFGCLISSDPNEEKNVAAVNPDVVQTMLARLAALADPKNGYHRPQLNVPHPRALPLLHNGTWAPFKTLGEELPPLTDEEIANLAAGVATAYWD